ncbi:Rv3235 family protein [Actinacidiphila sp. ITFR-21]|uniref:Rv3235 family protein n=1 Tax=Actinacidiphila sp. ITFR-21 TaxID=3075199 RepID=UPI00288A4E16|nr:Rv3235 family protein [Streptomyces sp. ITFR-21]WNI15762.1 Rv3235 family protein [Streptomyces sp. ITFR-21]
MRGPALPPPTPSPSAPAARRPAGAAPPGRRDTRRPPNRPSPAPRPAPLPATAPAAAPAGPRAPRPLPPHVWFAGRLLDVLTGRRPLTCLAGRVRDEAYQRLWELHAARTDWRHRVRGRTPYVYRCRVFRTTGGALEVAAVVALDQDVFRALAFRIEPGDDESGPGYGAARWRCTAVAAR